MDLNPESAISRRSFNTVAATAAMAWPLSVNAARDHQSDGHWIDAHVHVWHPDTSLYPISPNFKPQDMRPPSFTDEELLSHCEPAGVSRIVLIQMSFYEFDHRYMTEVMQRHPGIFSGVSLIDWNQRRLKNEVRRHKKNGMRGFRMHSKGDAKNWPTDPNVQKLWKLAAESDIAICPLINPEDIEAIDSLCTQFPETKVIIDHFARIGVSGRIEQDRLDQLCRVSRHPNTNVKTSAFYALGKKKAPYLDLLPMIKKVVDAFGAERLMWASDCPFQVESPHNYQSSIDLILKHANFLSEKDKVSILKSTAERLFF